MFSLLNVWLGWFIVIDALSQKFSPSDLNFIILYSGKRFITLDSSYLKEEISFIYANFKVRILRINGFDQRPHIIHADIFQNNPRLMIQLGYNSKLSNDRQITFSQIPLIMANYLLPDN